MSGPSIRRARPASATRYSSSSPPSRSTTAATAASTAEGGSSPRTSAAVASVTARHAVRQRSSQWVIAESAGASSNSTSGRAARKAPSGAQYITEPLPADTSGPRSATYRSAASATPSRIPPSTPPGEVPDVRRVGREPREVPAQDVVGHQLPTLGERSPEVPRHRRVVGPGSRWATLPGELERRDGRGDLLAPAELERRAQGVPERQPQDAAHDPFPQVTHGGRA